MDRFHLNSQLPVAIQPVVPPQTRSPGSASPNQSATAPDQLERPPSSKRLASIHQRNLINSQLQEDSGLLRTRTNSETRRFPDFDERTETEETLLEHGAEVQVLAVRVTREQIPLGPQEAAAAQANLDPNRIHALLSDN